ncbi:MAG: hypothetical protein FD169_1527 [Bacillota bacterium]|nr:MAG: hypothetical protein FD169_1527 [Bacillota bacterium]MBS3949094.1 hypothetical protein [Peptococcaceae bacterium]
MKRITILALLLVLLATPAFAMLKVLEAPLAKELEGLAKQHAASRLNVSVDKVAVDDAWLLEFFNIKVEVYVVPMVVNGVKTTEYVRVDTKAVLTEADIEALRAEDNKNAPKEPIFRTMSIGIDKVEAEAPKKPNYTPYVAGVVGLVVLGAGAIILKVKLN